MPARVQSSQIVRLILGTSSPQPAAYRSDSELLRGVAQAQSSAITALYRAHANSVFQFVYRRVEERFEDAEEITQDTFLSALKLATTYRGESSATTWLCGIARLRITDFYRSQNRDKRVPSRQISSLLDIAAGDSLDSLDSVLERISASQMVDRMMSMLPPDEREAMLLRYADQFSVKEISTLLGRTEKGVESLLSRAKSRLRGSLAELPPPREVEGQCDAGA